MDEQRLTFFCELNAEALGALVAGETVIGDLVELGAGVSLGILDLSPERAEVARRLNRAGVPVVAWLLLPEEEGYWFNQQNVAQAAPRYAEFKEWTARHGLQWAGVGLDIEPDIHEMEQLRTGSRRLLPTLARRAFAGDQRMFHAEAAYNALVRQIREDGYQVDSYQLPFIIDERIVGSTLLRRLAGLVDLSVDREVLMLYSSFFRPYGGALVWNYAPHGGAIGLGNTGGGVEIGGLAAVTPLSWEELSRDLRLARRWNDDIHIFSLEGCVRQGFLERLKTLNWDAPADAPAGVPIVGMVRRMLWAILWASLHPLSIFGGLLGIWWLCRRLKQGKK